MFGLDVDTLRIIRQCLVQFPAIEKVLLYGSRAKGNYKSGSDIDITLLGRGLTLNNAVYPLERTLDELYLPYTFDISVFSQLDNLDFIDHILRVGKTFYERESNGMPHGWEERKLGEVCEVFTDGDWIESKDQSTHGIRLIQTGNIGIGVFENKESKARFISESTFKKLRCTEVKEGDLLVSRLPNPVGRSCIIPKLNNRLITAVDCTIIRPQKNIYSHFLKYYQLSNKYFQEVNSRVTGTTRARISRKNLGDVKIPISPLPEQKRIVAVLDKAFAAIDKARENIAKNLQNTTELFQSTLSQIFTQKGEGWEERKLGDVCEFNPKKIEIKDLPKDTLVSFVPMKDINEHQINFEAKQKKSLSEVYSGYTYFTEDDVLLARVTPCFENGKAGIAKNLTNGVGFGSSEFFVYRADKKKIIPELVYYFISSDDFVSNGKKNMNGTSGLQRLTKDYALEYKIPLPPLSEQKTIVATLDKIRENIQNLEYTYQEKLNNLAEMKKAILERAFRGEL